MNFSFSWSDMMFLLLPVAVLAVVVGLMALGKLFQRLPGIAGAAVPALLITLLVGVLIHLNLAGWKDEQKNSAIQESSSEMSEQDKNKAQKAALAFEKDRAREQEARSKAQAAAAAFEKRMKAFEAYERRMAEEAASHKTSEAKKEALGGVDPSQAPPTAVQASAPVAIASAAKRAAPEKLSTPEEARSAADRKALFEAIIGVAVAAALVAVAWLAAKRRRVANTSAKLPDVNFLEDNPSKTLRQTVGQQEKVKQRF